MLQVQDITVLPKPSTPADKPGTMVQYRRWNGARNVTLTGMILGVITSIPRRANEVVYDYVIAPCDEQYAHLSYMVVNESDVVDIYDPLAGLTAFLKALRTQARIQQLQQDIPAEVARAAFLPGGEFYKPDSGDDSEVGE